jgi:hypothetical protein
VLRKILLACGILSSLLYVGIDVLVDPLFIAYDVLLIAFGVGVWTFPGRTRALHLVAGLLIAIAAVG